jgi:hypothetical protein
VRAPGFRASIDMRCTTGLGWAPGSGRNSLGLGWRLYSAYNAAPSHPPNHVSKTCALRLAPWATHPTPGNASC